MSQMALSPPASPTSSLTYFDPSHSDPVGCTSPAINSSSSLRFCPYLKQPATKPSITHPHALLEQNRGSTGDRSKITLSQSEATDIFMRGIQALPDDILRSAVNEKFATAEKSRYRLLVATWDVEETRRRVCTLEKIQWHLHQAHSLAVSEFQFWKDMYTDRGLPDLTEDELYYNCQLPPSAREADRDSTELAWMVEEAEGRGLDIDTTANEDVFDEGGGSGGALGVGKSGVSGE